MQEKVNITLKNGFHLVVTQEDLPGVSNVISIGTADNDDVFNQDIVKVYAMDVDNGEKFKVEVFLDPDAEDCTELYEVNLHHDIEVDETEDGPDEDDEDDEDDDEYYDELDDEDSDDCESEDDDFEDEDLDDDEPLLCYGCKGEEVKEIQRQLKALGYFNGVIGGNYLSKTQAAVEAFQADNGLEVTGMCDDGTYAAMFNDDVTKRIIIEPDAAEKRYAINADWWTSDIQKVFAKGVTAKITDVVTGLSWREQRRGGTNHADVQPLAKEDTANFKNAYGGKWAWTRRAIWVTVGDKTYAASMNGMPHGGSSIKDNGFEGHNCIHFFNSRTHGTNRVDENHQKMVKKASETPLPSGL